MNLWEWPLAASGSQQSSQNSSLAFAKGIVGLFCWKDIESQQPCPNESQHLAGTQGSDKSYRGNRCPASPKADFRTFARMVSLKLPGIRVLGNPRPFCFQAGAPPQWTNLFLVCLMTLTHGPKKSRPLVSPCCCLGLNSLCVLFFPLSFWIRSITLMLGSESLARPNSPHTPIREQARPKLCLPGADFQYF